MTETAGISQTSKAGVLPRTSPVTPVTATASPGGAAGAPQIQRISPTIRFDASAGVMITEYFNHKGEVQTQIPSEASVAYLRVGLTSEGEARKEAADSPEGKPDSVLA